MTFGTRDSARLRAVKVGLSEAGVRFRVESEWGSGEVSAAVLGAFNVSNLLATFGALLAAGIEFEAARAAGSVLEPVPGPLEPVGGRAQPPLLTHYPTPP